MRKLKGNLDILGNERGVTITLRDSNSRILLAEITLTPEEFCIAALGRQSRLNVDYECGQLDKIGKRMEHKRWSTEIIWPGIASSYDRDKLHAIIIPILKERCPEGWEPDLWPNSKGSIRRPDLNNRDKIVVTTTIRRWVDIKQDEVNNGD